MLDDPPQSILQIPYAPFSALLPRTAALIYHGGIGTLTQALSAGIPHLIVPMSHDQPDNATRLEHLGVGAWLKPKAYRAETAARELESLLDSSQVQEKCKLVRGKIDFSGSRQNACLAIERLM